MKKILVLFISFFAFSFYVYASDIDYDIEHYYVDATIEDDGDLLVKELIVMDGTFNGYIKDILFESRALGNYYSDEFDFEHSNIYNPSGLELKSIKGGLVNKKKVSFDLINNNNFTKFKESLFATNGTVAAYTIQNISGGVSYKMFHRSNGDTVAFLLEYVLDDAVVIHNDVAELYWQIISEDGDYDPMDDILIKVSLPGEDSTDNFKVWAHGPLYGEVDPIKSGDVSTGAILKVEEIDGNTGIDVRLTFDKGLILDDSSLDHSDEDALDKILIVEQERADEANQEREKLARIYNLFKYLSTAICIVCVVYFIYAYFKWGKKPKVEYIHKYNREFIDDYNVEVIDYLYKKNLTPNALTAAIMNLIYKKKITAEDITENFSKSKKKVYKFKLVNCDDLNESDKILVEFLFNKVGSDLEFTTMQLETYAASLSTGSSFNASYTKWMRTVKKIGSSQGFYRKKKNCLIIPIISLVISYFMMIAGAGFGVDFPLLYLSLPLSIALTVYLAVLKSYTEKGALHIKKWDAFKNFLEDFGTFDSKELPEVILWERYLVYAVIFGLASKVQKSMNVKIKELSEFEQTYVNTNMYNDLYLYNSIKNSFASAVKTGQQRYAASYANTHSRSSSGGGGGGGFSSGGGFGGGGGGGRGF